MGLLKGGENTMSKVNPTFSTNKFNEPKMLSPMESYVNDILMLLFGKPGFYPSIPTIGMNIQKYFFMIIDDINTEEIKSDLVSQCSDFFPSVKNGDFEIVKTEYKGRPLLLFVLPTIDDIKAHSVTIGVTTDEYGKFMYNFVENMTQMI